MSKAIEQAIKYAGHVAHKEASPVRDPAKPTDERRAHGVWVEPKGLAKHTSPMVDLAPDLIGVLYQTKRITSAQEQAARMFQELRAGYVAELGTKGYGSCLADNQSGYDDSDGNPEAIAAYRSLERRLGRINIALLQVECEKGPDAKPWDVIALRTVLDMVAG